MAEVIVIGGGPAGMMAAGTAAARGKDVLLIEKNNNPGKKLLITGKGRCNLTNIADIEDFINNVPGNGKFLYSAFYTFSNQQLIDFFNRLGMETKVERGGRVFPVSDNAGDVLAALKRYLHDNHVSIMQGEVDEIKSVENTINSVILKNGTELKSSKVIIATGGLSYPQTGSTGDGYKWAKKLGHSIIKPKPSLVPLEVKQNWVKDLQGLDLKNIAITVYKDDEIIYEDFGEMLFTHFGISGPVILSASSHLENVQENNYDLIIDLKPALSEEKLDERVQRDFIKYSRKFYGNSLGDLLPSKLIPVFVKLSGIPYERKVNQITKAERKHLVNLLKHLLVSITSYRPLAEAIVTSGGVNVEEIDPGNMESRLIKGLYFAGEVIDVDGYTGGYNLQIAFSTGYLAGINC